MEMHANAWKCLEINGNAWKYEMYTKKRRNDGNGWKCMEMYGHAWKCMETRGNVWKNAWKCLEMLIGNAKKMYGKRLKY